jgi:hypothetical protein
MKQYILQDDLIGQEINETLDKIDIEKICYFQENHVILIDYDQEDQMYDCIIDDDYYCRALTPMMALVAGIEAYEERHKDKPEPVEEEAARRLPMCYMLVNTQGEYYTGNKYRIFSKYIADAALFETIEEIYATMTEFKRRDPAGYHTIKGRYEVRTMMFVM